MKKTPLYDKHIEYGGKVIEFGGWLLPVQYKGIIEEHHAVRKQVGLFDVSHMGEFMVEGEQALAYLQYLLTNDFSAMQPKQIQYSPMCYDNGGTVDDLLVYKYNDYKFMLVVNAANIAKDWDWALNAAQDFDIQLSDISEQTAQLALQGPRAEQLLQQLTDTKLSAIPYYWFEPDCTIAGIQAIISRTGYTGEDGFEIYLKPEDAPKMWDILMEAGKEFSILAAGLGCRDTLRFECCMPLYGHELSAEITPLMAGMPRFVKLDKPENFIGKQSLSEQKAAGLKQRLVGIEVVGRGIARAGYPVLKDGKQIGIVTTGSPAPSLGKNMALAIMDAEFNVIDTPLDVEVRNKPVAAKVVVRPFYKKS